MATPSNTPIIAVTATAPDGKVSRRSIDEISVDVDILRTREAWAVATRRQGKLNGESRIAWYRSTLAKAEALAKEVNEIAAREGAYVTKKGEGRWYVENRNYDAVVVPATVIYDESPRPTVCGECFMERSGECL